MSVTRLQLQRGSAGNQVGSLSGAPSTPRWAPSSCSGLCSGIDVTRDQWEVPQSLGYPTHQLHGVNGRLATAWWTAAHNSVWASGQGGVNQGGGWLPSLFWLLLKLLPSPHYLCTAGLVLHVPEKTQQRWKSLEYILNSLHSLSTVWTSLHYRCAYIHTHMHTYTYI